AGVVPAAEHIEDGFVIVCARAAVTAVKLVDVDVTDVVEVAIDQGVVRVGLVECVVDVEHGLDGGAGNFLYDRDGFGHGLYDIALVSGERFHQNGDAASFRLGRDAGESLNEVPRGLLAAESAGSAAGFGGAVDQDT